MGIRCRARHRALGITGSAAALGALAAALTFGLTPSVSDADQRVQRLAAEHHANPLLDRLPYRLKAAVLAAEDHRFYRHRGIDGVALARAVTSPITGRGGGGATIEVQLAKWLYTGNLSTHLDQAEQAVLALKLDVAYPKSQVLLMYLNTVYFGHGYYGANAAAHGYFQVDPDALSWAQAALLAGLLKAPDGFDPQRHPAAARSRRDYVLRQLVATGAISAAEQRAAARADLQLSSR